MSDELEPTYRTVWHRTRLCACGECRYGNNGDECPAMTGEVEPAHAPIWLWASRQVEVEQE